MLDKYVRKFLIMNTKYEAHDVYINNIRTNAKITDISTNFNLDTCFCSCSLIIGEHYPDCPNAQGRPIGCIKDNKIIYYD